MGKVILDIVPAQMYKKEVHAILKRESKTKSVIYVSVATMVKSVIEDLKKQRVDTDKIFFIDCISRTIKFSDEKIENCLFLQSPQNLTALALGIKAGIRDMPGKKIFVFDSLSNMLVYNNEMMVGKFSNFIVNMLKSGNVDSIIFVLKSDVDRKIIKQIMSISDEVKNGV